MKNYEDFKREVAVNKTANGLVHFIDDCITKFIKNKNIGKELPIAFTSQRRDTSGKLIQWTNKGIKVSISN